MSTLSIAGIRFHQKHLRVPTDAVTLLEQEAVRVLANLVHYPNGGRPGSRSHLDDDILSLMEALYAQRDWESV